RMAAQGVEVGVARVQQHGDLVDVEGLAVTRACERAAHGRCGRPVVGSTHVSTLGRPDTRRPGSCPSLTRKVASPGLELYYPKMASIVGKKRNGRTYYYLVESARVNGEPRVTAQRYLGTADDIAAALDGGGNVPSRTEHLAFGDVAAAWRVLDDLGVADV